MAEELGDAPARAAVYAAAERAETRLGLSVNPAVRSLSRWEKRDDPLVEPVRTNPVVNVGPGLGTPDDDSPLPDDTKRSG